MFSFWLNYKNYFICESYFINSYRYFVFAYLVPFVWSWSNAENAWCIYSNTCNCNLKLICWTNFSGDHRDKIEKKSKSKGAINISQDFPFYSILIILYSRCDDLIFILSDLFVIYWKKCMAPVLMVLINVLISFRNIFRFTTLYDLLSKVNCHEILILYTISILNQLFSA